MQIVLCLRRLGEINQAEFNYLRTINRLANDAKHRCPFGPDIGEGMVGDSLCTLRKPDRNGRSDGEGTT